MNLSDRRPLNSRPSLRYCLPITNVAWSTVVRALPGLAATYDLFELWTDTLPGFELDDLENLLPDSTAAASRGRYIFVTGRRILAGGRHEFAEWIETPRSRALIEFAAANDHFFDIDVAQAPTHLDAILNAPEKPHLIASHHDFDGTADRSELRSLCDRLGEKVCAGGSEGVIKVATRCRELDDALRLIELEATLKSQDRRHVILGMDRRVRGEDPDPNRRKPQTTWGRLTRIYAALYGDNAWHYAPQSAARADSSPLQSSRTSSPESSPPPTTTATTNSPDSFSPISELDSNLGFGTAAGQLTRADLEALDRWARRLGD